MITAREPVVLTCFGHHKTVKLSVDCSRVSSRLLCALSLSNQQLSGTSYRSVFPYQRILTIYLRTTLSNYVIFVKDVLEGRVPDIRGQDAGLKALELIEMLSKFIIWQEFYMFLEKVPDISIRSKNTLLKEVLFPMNCH